MKIMYTQQYTQDIFFQLGKLKITMLWLMEEMFRSAKKKKKNDLRTYKQIPKIATDQGDDDATGVLLDFSYFEKYDKMIATDLSR